MEDSLDYLRRTAGRFEATTEKTLIRMVAYAECGKTCAIVTQNDKHLGVLKKQVLALIEGAVGWNVGHDRIRHIATQGEILFLRPTSYAHGLDISILASVC